MTDARASGLVTEALGVAVPDARSSAVAVEALGALPPVPVRTAAVAMEVLAIPAPDGVYPAYHGSGYLAGSVGTFSLVVPEILTNDLVLVFWSGTTLTNAVLTSSAAGTWTEDQRVANLIFASGGQSNNLFSGRGLTPGLAVTITVTGTGGIIRGVYEVWVIRSSSGGVVNFVAETVLAETDTTSFATPPFRIPARGMGIAAVGVYGGTGTLGLSVAPLTGVTAGNYPEVTGTYGERKSAYLYTVDPATEVTVTFTQSTPKQMTAWYLVVTEGPLVVGTPRILDQVWGFKDSWGTGTSVVLNRWHAQQWQPGDLLLMLVVENGLTSSALPFAFTSDDGLTWTKEYQHTSVYAIPSSYWSQAWVGRGTPTAGSFFRSTITRVTGGSTPSVTFQILHVRGSAVVSVSGATVEAPDLPGPVNSPVVSLPAGSLAVGFGVSIVSTASRTVPVTAPTGWRTIFQGIEPGNVDMHSLSQSPTPGGDVSFTLSFDIQSRRDLTLLGLVPAPEVIPGLQDAARRNVLWFKHTDNDWYPVIPAS